MNYFLTGNTSAKAPLRLALAFALFSAAAFCNFATPLSVQAATQGEPEPADTTTLPAQSNISSTDNKSFAESKPKAHLPLRTAKKPLRKDAMKDTLEETPLPSEPNAPLLGEILKLKWNAAPLQGQNQSTHKIGLPKVLTTTLEQNLSIRQAQVQVKDAETQSKQMPNLLNLLNPMDTLLLKGAAENNIQAAKAHLESVKQKVLLDSSRMYTELVQAFLGKYLAFQSIEQGKGQLRLEQARFNSGETTRFEVTQVEMVLLDRYTKYLQADNLYHTASMALSTQMALPTADTWVPEGVELQEQSATVPLLQLLPGDLSLPRILKTAQNRPDSQELLFHQEALKKLVKAASGLERDKKQAELHQLELESEKTAHLIAMSAEKSYNDYLLAQKNLGLANQQFRLANQFVEQLQVSYQAGFSSSKDVLDGEIELNKAKINLISAQSAYNLSQIQLLYHMGQLQPDALNHTWQPQQNTL